MMLQGKDKILLLFLPRPSIYEKEEQKDGNFTVNFKGIKKAFLQRRVLWKRPRQEGRVTILSVSSVEIKVPLDLALADNSQTAGKKILVTNA